MPDLLTHTLFVYPLKIKYKSKIVLILLGTILPDLLGRIPGVLISGSSFVNLYQALIHTPFMLLLFTFSFSFLFPKADRKSVFKLLILGIFIHLFLDMFQKTNTYAYLWFFPFSFSWFQIPLIWPDDTIFLIPAFIFINLLIFLLNKNEGKCIKEN